MKTFEFPSYDTRSLYMMFNCKTCEQELGGEIDILPEKGLSDVIGCEKCEVWYNVYLWRNEKNTEGYGIIEGLEQQHLIEIIDCPSYSVNDTDLIGHGSRLYSFRVIFENNILMLNQIGSLSTTNSDFINYFNNMVHASIVSSLEAYLSDSFEHLIKTNETYYKAFRSITEKNIDWISFHNMKYVKKLYQRSFLITFPDITQLKKMVKKRHDIVHRNGWNKDGEEVMTSEDELGNTIYQINEFVDELYPILLSLDKGGDGRAANGHIFR